MSLIVNQTLTNFARGLSQDLTGGSIAEFMAPTVIVPGANGQYKAFNDANAFQSYDTARAIGSDPTRIVFEAEDAYYNCKPHALEITVDKHERDQYGEGDPLGIEQMKIKTLLASTATAYERRVIAAAKTVSAVGSKGVWSGGSNDPVAEIDEQIEAIATAAGQMPNRLAIGLPAWRIIRNHANVIKRFPGSDKVGVTLAQFASLLLNPGIEVKVGILAGNSAKLGATASKANLVGSEVFVFLGSPNATQADPSFIKTFRTRSGGIDSVRTYTAPNGLYDGIIVDWSEDVKVTGAACARRITVS